jgi:serine/threonine protein kinase/peptidoglycan hydrolase-like protein with peptidoglycan-binding domain
MAKPTVHLTATGNAPGEIAHRELLGALTAGTRLAGYQLISVLGQGAFGITYHAVDAKLGRDVAIKEYLPVSLALRDGGTSVRPRSTDLEGEFVWGRERFLDEARTLVKLEDVPAVARVIDFLEVNGTAYMVMVLARGETLDQRIRRDGPLPPSAIDRLLPPLLDGLEQVHEARFLHRDIKPANIMVDARGHPTLIDFGAARAAMAGRGTAMTAIFTPGYAAAEQFTSARQGPWTDIYGLSATLYHAITGATPPSAFDRILDDTYAPLTRIAPRGFSRGLPIGIDAGLAVRAKDRPQSISDWRGILSGAVRPSEQVTVALPRRATADTPPTGRRIALWSTMVVAVGALVSAGGYFAFAPRTPAALVDPQALKLEDLERLLAERRAADAAAAEKKALEEEAQRKAEADAAAKRQADADLEKARADRQKAEAELAKLKADMETRRQAETVSQQQLAEAVARRAAEAEAQSKAETEMAALRLTEAEAQRKAEAEAENKRQADRALFEAQAARQKADEEAAVRRRAEDEAAARQRAEADARQKAEAAAAAAAAEKKMVEAEARQRAEAEKKKAEADATLKAEAEAAAAAAKKAAEGVESGLRLALVDRQRLQVALTSLGFDTRGTDGAFGPRSREMIGAWQQKSGAPATGFLSAAQRDELLRGAAPAVLRWDAEQKRLEDEKKKAEDEKKKADDAKLKAEADAKLKAEAEARAKAAIQTVVPVPAPAALPAPSAPAATTAAAYDGTYSGGYLSIPVLLRVADGRGSGNIDVPGCGTSTMSVTISATGVVSGKGTGCGQLPAYTLQGRADGRQLLLTVHSERGAPREITLSRRGN